MSAPQELIAAIETGWENRQCLREHPGFIEIRSAVLEVIDQLDRGALRIASVEDGQWVTHAWLKKAVLLSFRLLDNQVQSAGEMQFFDRVPLKFSGYTHQDFSDAQFRVVPPAVVRRGAYIAPNVVLMPSYVNIGAYVGANSMIDTWATVGSCAQIGKNVHVSGGVGIGGVLEPIQGAPVVIEDNCFIGARSEVVEGVIIGRDSVLSMGVFIGQSTKIYDRQTDQVHYGYVPPGSVVVPGTLPSHTGNCQLYCAVIVKKVDAETRRKTSINDLLRD